MEKKTERFNPSAYIAGKYRTFLIRIDREADPELIEHLEAQENFSAYLRRLIHKDMLTGGSYGKEKKHI